MSGNGTCGRPYAQNRAVLGATAAILGVTLVWFFLALPLGLATLVCAVLERGSTSVDGQVRRIEATLANAVAELEACADPRGRGNVRGCHSLSGTVGP